MTQRNPTWVENRRPPSYVLRKKNGKTKLSKFKQYNGPVYNQIQRENLDPRVKDYIDTLVKRRIGEPSKRGNNLRQKMCKTINNQKKYNQLPWKVVVGKGGKSGERAKKKPSVRDWFRLKAPSNQISGTRPNDEIRFYIVPENTNVNYNLKNIYVPTTNNTKAVLQNQEGRQFTKLQNSKRLSKEAGTKINNRIQSTPKYAEFNVQIPSWKYLSPSDQFTSTKSGKIPFLRKIKQSMPKGQLSADNVIRKAFEKEIRKMYAKGQLPKNVTQNQRSGPHVRLTHALGQDPLPNEVKGPFTKHIKYVIPGDVDKKKMKTNQIERTGIKYIANDRQIMKKTKNKNKSFKTSVLFRPVVLRNNSLPSRSSNSNKTSVTVSRANPTPKTPLPPPTFPNPSQRDQPNIRPFIPSHPDTHRSTGSFGDVGHRVVNFPHSANIERGRSLNGGSTVGQTPETANAHRSRIARLLNSLPRIPRIPSMFRQRQQLPITDPKKTQTRRDSVATKRMSPSGTAPPHTTPTSANNKASTKRQSSSASAGPSHRTSHHSNRRQTSQKSSNSSGGSGTGSGASLSLRRRSSGSSPSQKQPQPLSTNRSNVRHTPRRLWRTPGRLWKKMKNWTWSKQARAPVGSGTESGEGRSNLTRGDILMKIAQETVHNQECKKRSPVGSCAGLSHHSSRSNRSQPSQHLMCSEVEVATELDRLMQIAQEPVHKRSPVGSCAGPSYHSSRSNRSQTSQHLMCAEVGKELYKQKAGIIHGQLRKNQITREQARIQITNLANEFGYIFK